MAHLHNVTFGDNFPQQNSTHRRVEHCSIYTNNYLSMQIDCLSIICASYLFRIGKDFAFTFGAGDASCHIVDAENNILAWNNYRAAICRGENIVA